MAWKQPAPDMKSISFKNSQSINKTNDENKESTTLLWFDPNIESREDTEQTKQQLRHINDYVKFYTDLEECVTFIQSINQEKIFLITSGSKVSQLLPHVSSLPQVDSIFIFCMKKERYEHLLNEYSKIIGIYVNLDELCQSIREQSYLLDKQLQTFTFFDQHRKLTKDLSRQSGDFLWFQLFNYVITRLPKNQQAKRQMIDMCRQYYRGNSKELKLIDEFEQKYRSEEAIHWYSKQSFVYKLINKALRTEDIDLLYIFRFFISDLSYSLDREHEKILSSIEEILTVYRGMKLDKEEFDKLKENQGKLLSMNGYLSTSRQRLQAQTFAVTPTKRTDVISVLFQIECNIKIVGKSVIFADIAQFSVYPYEEEVLFNLNACFRIETIEQDGLIQLIKMNLSNEGELITNDYIKLTQKETEKKSISLVFGRLMCSLGEYEKSEKYLKQLLLDSSDEDLAWIEFNIGQALDFKGEWEEAREYYNRAYDRMMNTKPARIKDSTHVLSNIGGLLYQQGKYDEALDYSQRSLEMKEKYYPFGHIDIANSLNTIGLILSNQGKYDQALDCHQRARMIQEKYYSSDHISIADSLNNIANILYRQEKYDQALDCHQRVLKVREKHYPSGHIDISHSLNNIGFILHRQEKYDEALGYYQRALKIQEIYYPSGHANIAATLLSICSIVVEQEKYDEALHYYQSALKMQENCYPSGHADISESFTNIGNILLYQGKHDEALDYHQRALKMREKIYPAGHVDTGRSLNNIGVCYESQSKVKMALDYYQQALTIYKKFLSIEHPYRVKIESRIHRLCEDFCYKFDLSL